MIFTLEKKDIGDWRFAEDGIITIPFIAYVKHGYIHICSHFIEKIYGSQPEKIKLDIRCRYNGGELFNFYTCRISGDISMIYLLKDDKKIPIGDKDCCEIVSMHLKKNNIKYGDRNIVNLYIRVIEVKCKS